MLKAVNVGNKKGYPRLKKHGCLLPKSMPHLSTGSMWYCCSALFTSLELSCNTRYNPWTIGVLILEDSSHVLLFLENPFILSV